ncbi:MAG: cellulose biosynthesis cyclic di-GMP-binding regulatory protein BcsB, partial [Nitrospirota bacterium]
MTLLILTSLNLTAAETLRVPLTKLTDVSTVELKGAQSNFILKLPIPARWDISRARLHLSYVNSAALLPERSK